MPGTDCTPNAGGPEKAQEVLDTGYMLPEAGGEGRLLETDTAVGLANEAAEVEGGPIGGCPGCCGATLAKDDELDP